MAAGSLFELTLSTRSRSPEKKTRAVDFFLEQGLSHDTLVLSEWKSLWKAAVYLPRQPAARGMALKARRHLGRGWKVTLKRLETEDWMDAWKKRFRPSPLGKKFLVVPAWKQIPQGRRRIPVLMDPQGAFGSGLHETTRLITRLMEGLEGRFPRFLDLGTGTGILSILARHLGAGPIQGTDLDPGSVKTARFNIRQNRVRGAVMSRDDLAHPKLRGHFDLVAANMISKILLENRAQILRFVKPGGWLAVTGISTGNFPGFLKAFGGAPLRRVRVIRGRSWGAVLYQRKRRRGSL